MSTQKYDYREALKADILAYIEENGITWDEDTRDEVEEKLNEDLWVDDGVTGNGSGSYTFSRWQAEENLCHNGDLLGEALTEFGCRPDYLVKNGPEACDVTIRCYLLGEMIGTAMDEIEKEGRK